MVKSCLIGDSMPRMDTLLVHTRPTDQIWSFLGYMIYVFPIFHGERGSNSPKLIKIVFLYHVSVFQPTVGFLEGIASFG